MIRYLVLHGICFHSVYRYAYALIFYNSKVETKHRYRYLTRQPKIFYTVTGEKADLNIPNNS